MNSCILSTFSSVLPVDGHIQTFFMLNFSASNRHNAAPPHTFQQPVSINKQYSVLQDKSNWT